VRFERLQQLLNERNSRSETASLAFEAACALAQLIALDRPEGVYGKRASGVVLLFIASKNPEGGYLLGYTLGGDENAVPSRLGQLCADAQDALDSAGLAAIEGEKNYNEAWQDLKTEFEQGATVTPTDEERAQQFLGCIFAQSPTVDPIALAVLTGMFADIRTERNATHRAEVEAARAEAYERAAHACEAIIERTRELTGESRTINHYDYRRYGAIECRDAVRALKGAKS
jgi:hypothetical protein